MMQDLFNELWLVEAPLKSPYTVERLDWYPTPPHTTRDGKAVATVALRLTSPREAVIFDIQAALYSIDDTVHIDNSGLLDPKTIVLQFRVHIFGGDIA
jgi:hypothetical protein